VQAVKRIILQGLLAMLARPCYALGPMKKKLTPAQKAAKILSDLGASKGGKERAKALTPERRKQIAKEAAKARWGHDPENKV
jgi:hypothetical protein